MALYIARRLLWTIVVVFCVIAITYAVFYLLPAGDPALRRTCHVVSCFSNCTDSKTCHVQLDGDYYEMSGMPYCERHAKVLRKADGGMEKRKTRLLVM